MKSRRNHVYLSLLVALWGLVASISDAVAAASTHPEASATNTTMSGAQTTMISVSWQVVSSGGTNAQIGDMLLRGTAMQTAVGEVSSPNYRVRQGFWQNFFEACLAGDANGNGLVGIADAVFLVNYIFADGKAPEKFCTGDANSDGIINITDVVVLLRFVFQY